MERPKERLYSVLPEYYEQVDRVHLLAIEAFDKHDDYIHTYHRYGIDELILKSGQSNFIILEKKTAYGHQPSGRVIDQLNLEPKIGRFILGSNRSSDQYHEIVYREGLMVDCLESYPKSNRQDEVIEDDLSLDDITQLANDIDSGEPIDYRNWIGRKLARFLEII